MRPYEIGGLDVEIARLLIDEPDDVSEEPERMAPLWSERLRRNCGFPLIEELRVWGDKLPSSTLRAAQKRLKHMGLETDRPIDKQSGLAAVRATGLRFQPAGETLAERTRCVRDALGIGGGYVELWKARGGILATIQRRHLALEFPAVAPLSPSSACLVRSHTTGRCPCCAGSGKVSVFDETLVVAHPRVDPD